MSQARGRTICLQKLLKAQEKRLGRNLTLHHSQASWGQGQVVTMLTNRRLETLHFRKYLINVFSYDCVFLPLEWVQSLKILSSRRETFNQVQVLMHWRVWSILNLWNLELDHAHNLMVAKKQKWNLAQGRMMETFTPLCKHRLSLVLVQAKEQRRLTSRRKDLFQDPASTWVNLLLDMKVKRSRCIQCFHLILQWKNKSLNQAQPSTSQTSTTARQRKKILLLDSAPRQDRISALRNENCFRKIQAVTIQICPQG